MINALPLLLGDDGYQISRSVRLRASASAYFNRTPGSASNRTTWTWSGWLKRGAIGTGPYVLLGANNSPSSDALYFSNDALTFAYYTGTTTVVRQTTAVYRDPSSWYHIVVVADTTNTTAQNRMRFYINGSEITAWSTNLTITQNQQYVINAAVAHNLGCNIGPQQYTDGYLTEINFIDGQALTPSSFGETDAITGVWKPKKYTGTYGTNGFYLNFSDNSSNTATTIGKDYSGNGNNWTPNNISVTSGATYDSMLDVPTLWADGGNGRGNYCTLNPLAVQGFGGVPSYSNGNMTASGPGTANYRTLLSTMSVSSGKWYWEATITTFSTDASVGIGGPNRTVFRDYLYNGNKSDGTTNTAYGASYTTGDVIGVALDLDNGTLTFYKNGVSQGVAYNSGLLGSEWQAGGYIYNTGVQNYNFGQRPFAYTPPTGFKALNTLNLPEPTIKKGNQYFDATTYTGTGSAQSIVNSGAMQPDLVWTKSRSAVNDHILMDSVRGLSVALFSNLTNAEVTDSTRITSLNANGFTLGTSNSTNQNAATFVGWQWKEGATQGFDIVTYTGTGANRTIAHSLGVAPSMMIVKRRDSGPSSWTVWHSSFSSIEYIYLNLTNAKSSSSGSTVWNSTLPTSSVFSLGTYTDVNASGGTHVAYLFSEVAGFSKFGSYTGNGSADGPFVFCGFRPRLILLKRTDTTGNWTMYDTARNPYNAGSYPLYPNLSNAEDPSTDHFDWLSNGFKMRSTNQNTNGGIFIFAAFAEHPFKLALAR